MFNCRINIAWQSDPLRTEFVPFSLLDGNAYLGKKSAEFFRDNSYHEGHKLQYF